MYYIQLTIFIASINNKNYKRTGKTLITSTHFY